jgi:hypothetical protein
MAKARLGERAPSASRDNETRRQRDKEMFDVRAVGGSSPCRLVALSPCPFSWWARARRLAWPTLLSILLAAFLIVSPRHAFAGSADARDEASQVRWNSPKRQPNAPSQNVRTGGVRLKWKSTAAEPQPFVADGAARPAKETGPALRTAQGSEARYADAPAEPDKIKLVSLDEPADDPALDPFQDEVFDDESDVEEGDADLTSEESEFDADEIAQRSGDRDLSDMPDELRLNLDEDMPLPEMGEEYAQAPGEPERCPSPRDLKPINQISHRIAAEPGLFPQECALSDYPFQPRNFQTVTFTWKASALCHKPLYFQQPKLERYGHTFGPFLTPIISIGHFFVMIPCLPYNMGLEPPWECVYPLGWYRPGDCAPYTLGPLPLSLRGAATQGVITTGLWFLFP